MLQKFIETIEQQKNDIEEINISWYLYNNKYLHQYLKKISESGIKVNVITIPLEGYDNTKPQPLENLETGKKSNDSFTKYSLARQIFSEIYHLKTHPNFNVYFFSHLYVRSAYINKFSRGSLPYSLHIKSAYIKKKNGFILLLSSSNLAVRDLVKHESMVCIEDEPNYEECAKAFYKDLIGSSTHIKNYNESLNTSCNSYDKIDFKERIVICAQHLAAFNYQFNAKHHSIIKENETRQGVLGAVIYMANKGVNVTCLSQTFAPLTEDENKFKDIKFRRLANTSKFQKFYSELTKTKNVQYFVNENLHSKFIIIDNLLIYCSYNFTPTQFIYLDNVKIPKFKNMPHISYEGIHCEVGMHVVIEDINTVKA